MAEAAAAAVTAVQDEAAEAGGMVPLAANAKREAMASFKSQLEAAVEAMGAGEMQEGMQVKKKMVVDFASDPSMEVVKEVKY